MFAQTSGKINTFYDDVRPVTSRKIQYQTEMHMMWFIHLFLNFKGERLRFITKILRTTNFSFWIITTGNLILILTDSLIIYLYTPTSLGYTSGKMRWFPSRGMRTGSWLDPSLVQVTFTRVPFPMGHVILMRSKIPLCITLFLCFGAEVLNDWLIELNVWKIN